MKKFLAIMALGVQLNAEAVKIENTLQLEAVDIQAELAKDLQKSSDSAVKPLRYAVESDFEPIAIKNGQLSSGDWTRLNKDTWVWRLTVSAENAKTLDFGLHDFFLPPTAELRFYDWQGDLAKGPFTGQKNREHKQLWPGPIAGDFATVELQVSDKYKNYVNFSIKDITRGYRVIWPSLANLPKSEKTTFWENDSNLKSGSCNVDVVCPEGNDWRNQIRSVARYTRSGSSLCTGQMLNNTAQDGKPYFLTANHCGFNSSNAASINLWWNYESSECRPPGSVQSGTSIGTSGFSDTQSGSSLRANFATSDMALLELDEVPNSSYNVFYSGWDKRAIAPNSVVAIHHPAGHAKRISYENDPLTFTGYLETAPGIESHLRVADWDVGTTEGGSSGSAIWNSDKLIVGQLHGGYAACGNNDADWYGRLSVSWNGGGTPSSRLSDWLDPTGTGVETLSGLGECANINATISHSSSSEFTGVQQTFSVSASGGDAPYTYTWDINNDGQVDGTSDSLDVVYAQEFVGNVKVGIKDANNCTGSTTKSVVIRSPSVNLVSAGNPVQVSGNNDSVIDPGETWSVPVTVQNNGFKTAVNTHLAFEKKGVVGNVLSDTYGNKITECSSNFIDISSSGTSLPLTKADPSSNIDANDDGFARVSLTTPFEFYGNTVRDLSLSTNGYISTDAAGNGADFSNDCPLPSAVSSDSTAARLVPFHGDWVLSKILHQRFSQCPRTSELGDNLECEIFTYQVTGYWESSAVVSTSYEFQAILYPTVSQWVYQYNGSALNGANSTTGIQNTGSSDGISYACNTANTISSNKAVCVYDKNNQPQGSEDSSYFNLNTPALVAGDLGVSQQYNGQVEFYVESSAACGSPLVIDLQASVFESGFNYEGKNILNTTVGQNCTVFNGSSNSPAIHSGVNGLWYNPVRSGNGMDMYFIEATETTPENPLYIYYTATEDRSPVWYITTESTREKNQYSYALTKVSYNGPFGSSAAKSENVGTSLLSLTSPNTGVITQNINDKFSADLIQNFVFNNANTTQQRTGLWYNSGQSGWGLTVGTQGDSEVVLSYIYDNNGQPYWLIGSGNNEAVENISMDYINSFCPHCPKTSFGIKDAGVLRIDYANDNSSGTIEEMSLNPESQVHPGSWSRSNLPIQLLTPSLD